jgi:hypothetical protein
MIEQLQRSLGVVLVSYRIVSFSSSKESAGAFATEAERPSAPARWDQRARLRASDRWARCRRLAVVELLARWVVLIWVSEEWMHERH